MSTLRLSLLTLLLLTLSACNQTPPLPATPTDTPESEISLDSTTPESETLVGADADEHDCIGSAGYQWCPPKNKCLRIFEESCYDAEDALVKAALVNKYDWNPSDFTVTLNQLIDGRFASGGIKFTGAEVGGGYLFAAKVDGTWKIVADGNGIITCDSLKPYPDFPTDLIPECYDAASEQLLTR